MSTAAITLFHPKFHHRTANRQHYSNHEHKSKRVIATTDIPSVQGLVQSEIELEPTVNKDMGFNQSTAIVSTVLMLSIRSRFIGANE